MNERYTADGIRYQVSADFERLFSSYAAGRGPNWTCDRRTKDIVTISIWMREELTRIGMDDLGRRTQENAFNRHSRADTDLFELTAQLMNDALDDNIDRFRRPHRRWG